MVNPKRIKDEFIRLVNIDSLSGKEGRLAAYLRERLEGLGCSVREDNAGGKIGGETGNLIARRPGSARPRLSLAFNAHMDTVGPGEKIRPLYDDGRFHTNGETILGADDKSGLAILIEALECLREDNSPLEMGLVLTAAEETGLKGAKNLDYGAVPYKYIICLDHLGADTVVHRAPAAYSISFRVRGKEAHAGVAPEEGINAIQIAARAIAHIPLGRIDRETTANLGLIKGGTATNVVPNLVEVSGEARSHNMDKLEAQVTRMRRAFAAAVAEAGAGAGSPAPSAEEDIRLEFPLINVPKSSPLIGLMRQAAAGLKRNLRLGGSGGGSDANIFNGRGIEAVVLGTGMRKVHTTEEFILLEDMVKTAEMVLRTLCLNGRGG